MNHIHRLILNTAVKSPVGGASRPFSMSNRIGIQTMVRDASLTWLNGVSSRVGWANSFIVCPPFADNNGGQKSVAHPTETRNRAENRKQPTRRSHAGRALMAAAIALALPATPALAATVTWTGGGLITVTTWSCNVCWTGGAPNTGDDVVLAQSGGEGPINYNRNVTLQSLTLNTPTFGGG